jgi:hypothetical protein
MRIPSAIADRREAEDARCSMYPARRYLTVDRESDTSLLFLIGIRTIVMGGLAAQHVQPCPRNPLALNEICESRRAPGCVV